MSEDRKPIRIAADRRPESWTYSHPLNDNSLVHGIALGDATGLTRLGVHLIRVPPGKENFVYHAHQAEEECYFVLSGRGIAELEGEETEVGPGDFLGFPTGTAHHLRNPFDEELVYLVAGERHRVEVADFPKLRKRVIRTRGEAQVVDVEHLQPFWRKGRGR